MKYYKNAAILLMALSASAMAQSNNEPKEAKVIKDNIEKMIGKDQVDSVHKTPYAGLYELVTKGGIFYSDKEGKYFVAGNIIDTSNKKNLTEMRLSEVNKIDFKDLMLDKAIKYVKGDGSRVIAVFEDPNCGYCKMFRKEVHKLDNVTVYTFQYNILAPDSQTKSRNIWCSADKLKAWDDWMVNNVTPPEATDVNCTSPHETVLALGKKFRVSGTPTIFFQDGNRVTGMINNEQLEQKFKELKEKK